MQYTRTPQPMLIKYTLAFALCTSASTLPITSNSPKPLNKVLPNCAGPLHEALHTLTKISVISVCLFIGFGICFIFRHFVMPKSTKNKRVVKDYSIKGMQARRGGIEEKGKPMIDSVNRIWINSVMKGGSGPIEHDEFQTMSLSQGHGAMATQAGCSTYTSKRPPTLTPLTITNTTRVNQGPESVLRSEMHNFGENPQYHDDSFQYTPPDRTPSLSNPPSPFSSRFCSTNVRKLFGHKRSLSTPAPCTSFEGLTSYPSNFVASPHFPLPTLRPITPPDTMSAPTTPHPHSEEESLNTMNPLHYAIQNPKLLQGRPYQRAESVPLLGPCTKPKSKPCDKGVVTPGFKATRPIASDANSPGNIPPATSTEFQPVMICEQGQSASGQRWKRKVTVFRSDILDRFKQNGVVEC